METIVYSRLDLSKTIEQINKPKRNKSKTKVLTTIHCKQNNIFNCLIHIYLSQKYSKKTKKGNSAY